MSYISDALSHSPDAYYRLGEASGSTMTDSSGNSRNGTYTGTVTYGTTGCIPADSDKAITFPGNASTGSASVAYASWMNRTTFTAIAWFKTTDTGLNYIVSRWGSSSANQVFAIDLQSSNVIRGYARLSSNTRTASATVTGLRDGNWHMAALTYDGTNLSLVVDGVVRSGPTAWTGPPNTPLTEDIKVGFRTGGPDADQILGSVDEVYFGPALSDATVTALYNTATGVAASGSGSLTLSGSGSVASVATAGSGALSLSGIGRWASTYDQAVLADTPWAYFPTDETDDPLHDYSGNERDVLFADPPFGPNIYGATGPHGDADAVQWEESQGATERYGFTAASVGASVDEVTLECWFYATGVFATLTPLVSLSNSYGTSDQDVATIYADSGERLHLRWGDSPGTSTTIQTVADIFGYNQWYHVVAQITPTGAKLRLNKVDVASGSGSTLINSAAKFFLHGGDLTDGRAVYMSKPAVYLSTLSDARTDAHYDAMDVPQAATGTGSLTLSGSGSGAAPAVGAGSLSLSATGTVDGVPVPATGSGSLTLSGSGVASLPAAGEGSLELFGEGVASALYLADISNALQGRDRGASASVRVLIPATYTPTTKVDKAVPLPVPTMVNGRPT